MASLREIRDHIGSVRSTLKITSAMKLVSSAKLRKAQQAAESLRVYSDALSGMLGNVLAGPGPEVVSQGRVAVVAIASNSSLCGAFNINVARKVQEVVAGLKSRGIEADVFAVGRKMSEAARKAGHPQEKDWSALVGRPSFERSTELSSLLMDAFSSGRYGSVMLVYNHFVNTASQKVVSETWLPLAPEGTVDDYILEPSREAILRTLLPQVMRLRFHTAILDSAAAEHAARTVAMQAASDNAEDLLAELTLEYNKGRQQKITAEILDLVAGARQ